jgi:ATP/maltotriose-dependent transcriptional regulator MalT
VERARAGLDQVEEWLDESRNHEQLAELARLRARAHAERGEGAAATRSLERALAEARETQSPRVSLGIELERVLEHPAAGAAATQAPELERLLDEATKLGSAPLRLRAGEGLGEALRGGGRESEAEQTLRATLRLVQDCGGQYAGAYRVHLLLAESLLASGRADEGRQSLENAEREVSRIAEGLDTEAAAALESLDSMRRLRRLAQQHGRSQPAVRSDSAPSIP